MILLYRHWDSVQCSSDEITGTLQNGMERGRFFWRYFERARDQNELPYSERQKSAVTIYISTL